MIQTIQANNLTLFDVERKFNLISIEDDRFFQEWLEDLPEVTSTEKQILDKVKANYLYLVKRPMLEDAIKMVVLSPLLDLAGFYHAPFYIETETQIEIDVSDEDETIKGRIDVLVVSNHLRHKQIWVVVIESKKAGYSATLAIPQTLTYMMSNLHVGQPVFGLVTNGSEFIFAKLAKHEVAQYALSDLFTLIRHGNDLYQVLSILKKLGELALY
ncbi:type I restriction endonuclease [Pseudanabaena sp. PCC 6802]|uniref:type I restriction endonuclease n=1 Tax=Pseudanabaena sp. PCC 6802 TaxID=118173 RepID=UPI00034CB28E|nr:type I restriction endonuclease [Pseudanabaena sp. PCC 6802]